MSTSIQYCARGPRQERKKKSRNVKQSYKYQKEELEMSLQMSYMQKVQNNLGDKTLYGAENMVYYIKQNITYFRGDSGYTGIQSRKTSQLYA